MRGRHAVYYLSVLRGRSYLRLCSPSYRYNSATYQRVMDLDSEKINLFLKSTYGVLRYALASCPTYSFLYLSFFSSLLFTDQCRCT